MTKNERLFGVIILKTSIRVPFFEIGVKNYIYGDDVMELARAADAAAGRYDIDVLFIAPYTEIRRVSENTRHLVPSQEVNCG
ncbi:MAG: hypothetical protein LBG22_11050 [Treponema sp.]|jgi:triosephosphate isomerase|nr:hypothetical protein [Treponema sp.]